MSIWQINGYFVKIISKICFSLVKYYNQIIETIAFNFARNHKDRVNIYLL